ncbi:hypothetical protein V1264_007758 [Littorina saxatilis]|uniref:Uncharacterized protein n=1 Tax=Littorina saxatilis TaxID=31220 RepID=A0AAN9AX40_9CAEN
MSDRIRISHRITTFFNLNTSQNLAASCVEWDCVEVNDTYVNLISQNSKIFPVCAVYNHAVKCVCVCRIERMLFCHVKVWTELWQLLPACTREGPLIDDVRK